MQVLRGLCDPPLTGVDEEPQGAGAQQCRGLTAFKGPLSLVRGECTGDRTRTESGDHLRASPGLVQVRGDSGWTKVKE